jgi:DNA polymerase-3 subunit alpha
VLLYVEAEADGETVKVRVQRMMSLERAAEGRHTGIAIYLEETRGLDSVAEQIGGKGGQGELRLVLRLDDAAREVEFVLPQGIDATPKQRSALKLVEGVAEVRPL